MKKIFFVPLFALSIVAMSCKKEVPQPINEATDQDAVQNDNMNQRQSLFSSCADWQIASFKQGFSDQTRNYRLTKLTFCPDNTVTLYNDILSVNGNWHLILSRANPQYLVLNFDFQSPETGSFFNPAWMQLEGMWQIKKSESYRLSLRSVTGNKNMVIERPGLGN